ncbi:MAG TPA: calcium-binding protein [Bryobacteraceae bacterium]|nr:calcium-binding protein [Bryobacteraceae bacterium]
MTAIAAQITPTTISTVVQPEADSIASAPTSSVGSNTFVFFAAFDGTWNNSPPINGDTQDTAIAQLAQEVKEQQNATSGASFSSNYFPGIGASNTLPDESGFTAVLPTPESIQTAKDAYDAFAAQAFAWRQKPGHENDSVTSMISSFSRGAAAAAIFSQMLYEEGLVFTDPQTGKRMTLIPPGTVGAVSAALILDPVLTGETGNMDFPPGVQNLTIVRAQNEYRTDFEAAKYSSDDHGDGENVITVAGNHGDVGDAYDNGLGGIYLDAYTRFFQNAGLTIGSVDPLREYVPLGQSVALHSETETAAEIIVNRKFWDATYNPNAVGDPNFITYARQTDSAHGTAPMGTSFTAYNGDIVLYGSGGSLSDNGKHITVLAGASAGVSGYGEVISAGAGATLNFTSTATSLDPAFATEITAADGATVNVTGPNVTVKASNATIALDASANSGIQIEGKNNHIIKAPGAEIYDPAGTVAAQNTIEVKTTANNSAIFDTGTHGAASDNGSITNISMATDGLLPLGTLAIDTAFVADPNHPDLTGVTFALADGFTFDLPSILASETVQAVTDPNATPLQALESYLADLGFTYDLNLLNTTYLHPTGDAYALPPTQIVPNQDSSAVDDIFQPEALPYGQPGAQISGHTEETINVQGNPVTVPVEQNILNITDYDLSQSNVSGIDVINIYGSPSITADQFTNNTLVINSNFDTIHAVGGGTLDLTGSNVTVNGVVNLTADTWQGTVLIGNDANGQVLTASLFGDDFLQAGNGNNVQLIAGLGVDSLVGGTGTDTEFHAEDGLAAGSYVVGNGTGDLLVSTGDLSAVNISGVEQLDNTGMDLTLTAAQFNGFDTFENDKSGSTLHAKTGGTYDLTQKDQAGYLFDNVVALSNLGTTLKADSGTLTASESGTDTLTLVNAGTLVAGKGVDTLILPDSGDIYAANGLAAGSSVQGDVGLFYASGDISQASLSGSVYEFDLYGGDSVTMSGGQFNAIDHFLNQGDGVAGLINITSAGTYTIDVNFDDSLHGPEDYMFDMTALNNGGTTLQEDLASDVILTASASGNDTLISNYSDFVTLDASGTSGTKTLTMDHGTNGELAAEDSTGTIIFNSTNNTTNILDAIGATGAVTFNAATDTGDEIFTGDGASTVYAGLDAVIYGGDGTDTVVAGLGNAIYGGDGNDTYYINLANQIYGGTGNDLFVANLPLDEFTVIDGGGGNDSLYVNNYAVWGTANDISLADISGVSTLTDNALNLSLTADQLAGFSTLTNTTGMLIPETLAAATAGTYSLAGKTVNGAFNLGAGLYDIDVTLIGNDQDGQVLIGGQGTDTLQAGNGNNVTLIAGTGNTTLIAGTGTETLIGGTGTDTFVMGGAQGAAQLALADAVFSWDGSILQMVLGDPDTIQVQNGQNATVVGSDGTMSVNNNASGGLVQNIVNLTAGGSTVEEFHTLSGGAWNETDQGHTGANGTGSVTWADTIIHNANGSLSVNISGAGGVFSESNATFAAGNGTSATLTGDYNSLQIGDNSTIVFAAGADHDFAFCGSYNTVTFNGVYESFIAYGGYNTVYLNGDGNVEQDDNALDGDNSPGHNTFVVNANHNTLSLAVSNDVATVTSGNNNTVIARKNNDSITVSGGTGNFAEDVSSGNTIVLNGTSNKAQINNYGTLTMGGTNNLGYSRIGDTVTVGGSSNTFIAYNSANTVTDTGTGNLITDASTNGANTISLTGSSATANINNTAGDILTIGGTNNTVNVNHAMTAAGTATFTGTNGVLKFTGATSDQIIFNSGATGKLVLSSAQTFAGTVAGMDQDDSIDLKNFHFSGSPTISNVTGTGDAGTATNVTVTDGSLSVTLALMNQYANQFAVSSSAYTLSADGTGGNAGTLFQLASGQ